MKVLTLYRENRKVMLAHELSFKIMVSEVPGSLDFLPFPLPELTASPTMSCIVVALGEETDAKTELGLCSLKLTAATA